MIELSIVIPVYNEIESLGSLCENLDSALRALAKSYEVVLVDDGSTDGTWDKLKELASRYGHMRLIRLRRNFGQTAAMSAGFHHAQGRVVVTLDADLQNDPADIPRLLERLDAGVDVVSGWRVDRQDKFLSRRLPSMIANGLISRITGVHLHDYGCTLKAYRREAIQNVHLYGEMHRFIPALVSWVGGTVDEVPVTHHPRRYGKSKYGLSRTVRVVLDLLTVSFLMRYSTRPIQIFGRLGLNFLLPGVILLGGMLAAQLSYHLFGTVFAAGLIKRPFWVITAFMLILFGIQFISMGLMAELQTRTYHEAQGKPIYTVREIVDPRAD